MGSLGKLSDFGKTGKPQPQPEPQPEPTESKERVTEAELKALPPVGQQQQQQATEKLVAINIKIPRAAQSWLAETARTVRDNNDTPVAPSERVFPQHLIGVAIDLLRDTDIDWSRVRNISDLRQQLKV